MSTWGHLLRRLRVECGLNQRQISRLSGVNRGTVRRLEEGTGATPLDRVEKLLNVYGYELDAMLVDEGRLARLKAVAKEKGAKMTEKDLREIEIVSFGFKYGPAPHKPWRVFDCRKLRNPHGDPSLRVMTGKDLAVQNYVTGSPGWADMMAAAHMAVTSEGCDQVAFGCVGGKHRSVAAAEALKNVLSDRGYSVTVRHKQL